MFITLIKNPENGGRKFFYQVYKLQPKYFTMYKPNILPSYNPNILQCTSLIFYQTTTQYSTKLQPQKNSVAEVFGELRRAACTDRA